MKNLKLLVMFVIFIIISQIGLSQIKKTYFLNEKGIVVDGPVQAVTLSFAEDAPQLSNKQIVMLYKHKCVEISRREVKGEYKQFVLFYVPRIEADSCFLADNGTVFYQPFRVASLPMMFSWWFFSILLAIVCMIFFQTITNRNKPSLLHIFVAIIALIVAFFAPIFALMALIKMFPTTTLYVISIFTLIILLRLVGYLVSTNKNLKFVNVYIYMDILCMYVAYMCICLLAVVISIN